MLNNSQSFVRRNSKVLFVAGVATMVILTQRNELRNMHEFLAKNSLLDSYQASIRTV